MSRRSAVPDRWLNYCKLGKLIGNTRIFAFKVPLRNAISDRLPPEARLSPEDIVSSVGDLSLVIDLTNTDRYYSAQCFTGNNIDHVKIRTEGHVIPAPSVVNRFFDVMDGFYARKHCSGIVGVHCTHGVNRTGYLVCRYLIERFHLSPATAIEAFGSARGHYIERQNYLDNLHTVALTVVNPPSPRQHRGTMSGRKCVCRPYPYDRQ